ncbi:MAG: serine/threonine-protein kinase, partial [Myxococcota bacterium]
AGQAGAELYLVMEYVDGPALAEIVEILRRENKILPVEVSCGIVSSIALGLTHAHERALPDGTPLGIVHRDVAPENVLIGSEGVPKLVDFGLATLSGHSLTEPGTVRGRPRALSPEQARGDATDVRSDIFSLGAMLFELVAGQSLYPNEAVATLLWKVAAGDYAPLAPRLSHIDADLVELIKKALAVEPSDRFRSAREMERALDHFRAGRGMRMSSRALTQVVNMTWPQIQKMRAERTDTKSGELEGARLVLPADQLDWDIEQTSRVAVQTGDFPLPQARIEGHSSSPTTPARPRSPLDAPIGGHFGPTAYPKPDLARGQPDHTGTRSTDLGGLSRHSDLKWLTYLVLVLASSAGVFAWVWSAHAGH